MKKILFRNARDWKFPFHYEPAGQYDNIVNSVLAIYEDGNIEVTDSMEHSEKHGDVVAWTGLGLFPIDCRAKRKSDCEWIYGMCNGGISPNMEVEVTPKEFHGPHYHEYEQYEIDEDTIGEYTKKLDIHRNRIYEAEGDIVKFKCMLHRATIGEVVFLEEGLFAIQMKEKRTFTVVENEVTSVIELDSVYVENLEVIGNIYDNPELLEENR